MEKSINQIKNETVSYLTKTSKHTFTKPDGTFFKVIGDGNGNFQVFENGKIRNIDVDDILKWYGPNSKNVIKHKLFLNKDMKSVRNIRNISNLETR